MQQSLYNVPVGFMYMPFGFDNMQSSLEDMPWYMSDMQSGFLYMPSGFQYMLECAGRFVYEAWKKNLKDAYFDEKDQFMNDETTSRQIAQNAALLNADAVMSAIANPMRRAILAHLCDGEPMGATDIAGLVKSDPSNIARHFLVMRRAGIIVIGRGKLHRIPPQFMPVPGARIVDFGHCLLRLDVQKPPA